MTDYNGWNFSECFFQNLLHFLFLKWDEFFFTILQSYVDRGASKVMCRSASF